MAIQIRQHTYRGNEGFLIYGNGNNTGIFGVNIFVRKRETAEAIKAIYKTNYDSAEIDRLIRGESQSTPAKENDDGEVS